MAIKFYYVLLISVFVVVSCSKKDNINTNPAATNYYPPVTGNVWDTTSAAALDWDIAKLQDAINYVEANNSTAFIILYKGKIVTEKYWLGWNASTSSRIFSATKSIVAFLTGIANQQGKIDVNMPVNTYLIPGWSMATLAQENVIKVKDLLTMTSGLNNDLSYNTNPNTKWYYNTIAYYKTIDLLEKVYNQPKTNITNNLLWSKIGMQQSFWDTEPNGGSTMSCSARDMARFGLLIANNGIWNRDTILNNTAYLQTMLNSSQALNKSYGYLWWLNGKSSYVLPSSNTATAIVQNGSLMPDAPVDLVAALGANDKKIYVVKSKDLVVVRHGAQSNAASTQALSSFDNEIWKRLMLAIK